MCLGIEFTVTSLQTLAKPMQNILRRLASHQSIEIQIFSDEVILHQPVDEWPVVDCLVAFYSDGFPLDKAIAYVDLRQPMVVNDLQEQYTLMDRCVCVCVCVCVRVCVRVCE